MAVLFFQLIIFGIIFISSYSGRKTLEITAIVIFIFTIFAVFASWLMILQFITIIFAYLFALDKMTLRAEKLSIPKIVFEPKTDHKSDKGSGCLAYSTIFIIIIGCLYAYNVWSVKNSRLEILPTPVIKENTTKIINGQNYYESYEYDASSYDEPTYVHDTMVSFNETYNDDKQNEIEYNYDEYDDEYGYDDDYGYNDKNSNATYGIRKYGQFKFLRDNGCDIENATLEISRNGVDQFDFILIVENKYHIGQISGTANIQNNRTRAIFKSANCELLAFDFLNNGQVVITETNCRYYHGTNICFDSVFY